MKKKIFALLLVAVMALVMLIGCAAPAADPAPAPVAEDPAPEPEPEPEEIEAPEVLLVEDVADDEDAIIIDAPRAEDELDDLAVDEYQFPGAVGSTMVIMLKDYTNPVWIECAAGARAAAEHFGVGYLLVQAPVVSNDNLEQIQLIEQAIARGDVDIYVLIPSDSIGIVPAVYSLNQAGIPVINLNTWINAAGTDAYFETFIIADNWTCGQYAARELARLAGEEGEVVLFQGPSGGQVTIDITRGFEEAIAEFPDIDIVYMFDAGFNRANAYAAMQNILAAHPNLRMVASANDEMALGALAALEAAGRRNGDDQHIFIGGIDGNQEAILAVYEGRLDFTVDKSFFRQGWAGIYVAARFLDGETDLPEQIPLEIHLILQDNAQDFLN